jgi:hypothetical protein
MVDIVRKLSNAPNDGLKPELTARNFREAGEGDEPVLIKPPS